MECRICFEKKTTNSNPMLSPCKCNGTIKYVHERCLEKWRNVNINKPSFQTCLICRYNYILGSTETFTISQLFINRIRNISNYIMFHIMTFISASIINMINPSQLWLIKYKIKDIKKDNIYNLSYYYSFLIIILTIFLYLGVFLNIILHIKNKCKYLKKSMLILGSNFIFSLHFLFLNFLIINKDFLKPWLILEIFLSSLNLLNFSFFLEYHNEIINLWPKSIQNIV